jgi:hypothetical protein
MRSTVLVGIAAVWLASFVLITSAQTPAPPGTLTSDAHTGQAPPSPQAGPVTVLFYNPGLAVMDVYSVSPEGAETRWGAIGPNSSTIPIPSHPGQLWRFRLSPSANADSRMVRDEYRATAASGQRHQVPGFLNVASEPSPDFIATAVAELARNVEIARAALMSVASCPDMEMRCPTGEPFARGTNWDADTKRCRPLRPMSDVLREKCPYPYAGKQPGTAEEYARSVALWQEWDGTSKQAEACNAELEQVISVRKEYSELFNDACIVHDLCYRSPRDRQSCDDEFLDNMQARCRKLELDMLKTLGTSVGACMGVAQTGYELVETHAEPEYKSAQKLYRGANPP